MKTSFRRFAPVLALLSFAAPAHAEVVIGVAGPMSGAFADLGAAMEAGVRAAAEALNARGGIGGEPAVVEVVDDKCDAATGAAVANQLVGRGARLVVGHACTAAALPAAAVYAEHGVVLISPAATNPRFTDERVGPGVFRMAPRSDAQAQAIADHLLAADRPIRVGFAHDGSAYGQGLVDAVRVLYEAAGGRPALVTSFIPGEDSQNALAGAVQDAGVTELVVGAQQADAAVIAAEIRARGLPARILGGDPLGLEEFVDLAGPAAEGVVFTLPDDWSGFPGADQATGALAAAGIAPSATGVAAYSSVEAYAAAVAEAGPAFGDVVARMRAAPLPVLAGTVAFDDKGDLDRPGYRLYGWTGRVPTPIE